MFTQCLAPRVIFYLKTLISVTICHIKRNFFHSVSIHLSHNICRQTLFKHANSWQQKIPEEGLTAEFLETNQLSWSRLEYLINECWLGWWASWASWAQGEPLWRRAVRVAGPGLYLLTTLIHSGSGVNINISTGEWRLILVIWCWGLCKRTICRR